MTTGSVNISSHNNLLKVEGMKQRKTDDGCSIKVYISAGSNEMNIVPKLP
jgi:hypothetical protein